jgi:hypothetical protein
MKLTLTTNIGSDDLRRFGVLPGGDPEALKKALADYSKGKTVDAQPPFSDYLLKQGLATTEVKEVKGVAPSPSVKAPAKPETFADNPHDPKHKADR